MTRGGSLACAAESASDAGKSCGYWPSGTPASLLAPLETYSQRLLGAERRTRLRLTRAELLTVYSIVLVVTPLFGIHVLFYVLSKAPSFYHMARIQPVWGASFVNLIPTWWGPSSLSAVDGYFMGGVGVPWSEWALPLVAWGSFMAALYLANVSLLVLVQQQWIRHERLTFPLAQVPLETVDEAQDGSRSGWWPFHPIGYLLSNSISQAMGTFPFFIAWALKALVTRYGGLRLYRQTIPLAVGLIVGDLLNNSIWNILTLVTNGRF